LVPRWRAAAREKCAKKTLPQPAASFFCPGRATHRVRGPPSPMVGHFFKINHGLLVSPTASRIQNIVECCNSATPHFVSPKTSHRRPRAGKLLSWSQRTIALHHRNPAEADNNRRRAISAATAAASTNRCSMVRPPAPERLSKPEATASSAGTGQGTIAVQVGRLAGAGRGRAPRRAGGATADRLSTLRSGERPTTPEIENSKSKSIAAREVERQRPRCAR
jgi:hypothetical protein